MVNEYRLIPTNSHEGHNSIPTNTHTTAVAVYSWDEYRTEHVSRATPYSQSKEMDMGCTGKKLYNVLQFDDCSLNYEHVQLLVKIFLHD